MLKFLRVLFVMDIKGRRVIGYCEERDVFCFSVGVGRVMVKEEIVFCLWL